MSFDAQFQTLFNILDEQIELDSPFKKVIKQAVEGAGFTQLPKQVGGFPHTPLESKIKKGANGGVPRGKKLSGYNLFISAAMKGEVADEKLGMGEAVALWKALGDDSKQEWNEKAKQHNETSTGGDVVKPTKTTKKSKGKRKPSGYNLFTKAKMAELKQDESILAGDRLKTIGTMWKKLEPEERAEWNAEAKAN